MGTDARDVADADADADALPAVKTEAAFARALRDHRSGLLVVNYGADWCSHCAKLSPTLRRLRREYELGGEASRASSSSSSSSSGGSGGGVAFVDADVDGLPFTAREVRWTPTVAFYRRGRLVDECVRARPTQVSDRTWLHAVEDPDEVAGWR